MTFPGMSALAVACVEYRAVLAGADLDVGRTGNCRVGAQRRFESLPVPDVRRLWNRESVCMVLRATVGAEIRAAAMAQHPLTAHPAGRGCPGRVVALLVSE